MRIFVVIDPKIDCGYSFERVHTIYVLNKKLYFFFNDIVNIFQLKNLFEYCMGEFS